METLVDLTCGFVMVTGSIYLGVAFVLEMIDRWNALDPATIAARKQARAEAKAMAGREPLALPAASVSAVDVQRQLEPVTVDSNAIR